MKFLFSLILILFFSFKEMNNLKIFLFGEIIVKLCNAIFRKVGGFLQKNQFFSKYISSSLIAQFSFLLQLFIFQEKLSTLPINVFPKHCLSSYFVTKINQDEDYVR